MIAKPGLPLYSIADVTRIAAEDASDSRFNEVQGQLTGWFWAHRVGAGVGVILTIAAVVVVVVLLASGGSNNEVTQQDAFPTYTGPITGYTVHDPGDRPGSAAQLEGVIYNDLKSRLTPPPFVDCEPSGPDSYDCGVYDGTDPNTNHIATLNVQVHSQSGGSVSANCAPTPWAATNPCPVISQP